MTDMTKLLEPWTRKVITGAIQINQRLIEKNVLWEDVEKWLNENHVSSTPERPTIRTKNCPECGHPMRLYPVNRTPDCQIDPSLNSQWLCGTSCSGKGCWYEEFSTRTIEEEYKSLMEAEK